MADRDWTHKGNIKLLKQSYEDGNKSAAYDVLEYCLAEKKPLPVWAARAIVKDYRAGFARPKKMGRHSRTEERVKQFQSDLRCHALVSVLVQRGLSKTQAEERTGRHVGLSKTAVFKACNRIEQKYLSDDLPNWITLPVSNSLKSVDFWK